MTVRRTHFVDANTVYDIFKQEDILSVFDLACVFSCYVNVPITMFACSIYFQMNPVDNYKTIITELKSPLSPIQHIKNQLFHINTISYIYLENKFS